MVTAVTSSPHNMVSESSMDHWNSKEQSSPATPQESVDSTSWSYTPERSAPAEGALAIPAFGSATEESSLPTSSSGGKLFYKLSEKQPTSLSSKTFDGIPRIITTTGVEKPLNNHNQLGLVAEEHDENVILPQMDEVDNGHAKQIMKKCDQSITSDAGSVTSLVGKLKSANTKQAAMLCGVLLVHMLCKPDFDSNLSPNATQIEMAAVKEESAEVEETECDEMEVEDDNLEETEGGVEVQYEEPFEENAEFPERSIAKVLFPVDETPSSVDVVSPTTTVQDTRADMVALYMSIIFVFLLGQIHL